MIWYDWPGENFEKKISVCEILMNPHQFLRISDEPYDLLTINLPKFLRMLSGCYEYLRMSLQILRMLPNALWSNLWCVLCFQRQSFWRLLWMKWLHNVYLPMFSLCRLFASIHRVNFLFKVVILHHAQGKKKGLWWRGQGKVWPSFSWTHSASDGAE